MRKPACFSRPTSRETGLEMPGIPVKTGYGWKSLVHESNFRPLSSHHHVMVSGPESSLHLVFFLKKLFSQKTIAGQNRSGKRGHGTGKGGKSTGLCVRSWLSGNLGKTALRLTEIIRMYFDTSLKTSRRDYSGLSGPGGLSGPHLITTST
jgi:hypothetical protein